MTSDHFAGSYRSAMKQLPLRPGLEEHILESLGSPSAAAKKRGSTLKRVAAAAAAIVLLFAIGIPAATQLTEIDLPRAQGRVSVHYTLFSPKLEKKAYCLIDLTEEELFHTANLAPFYGTVEEIHNIRIDLNGSISYRAIADVNVEKAYLSNVTPGSTVSILLPCSIGRGEQSTATELAASLRKGSTGIFMPVAYSETDSWKENGACLYLRELAPYGLKDGMRFLFLKGEGGEAVFERSAYPSLRADASFDHAERFVEKMLSQ